MIRTIWRATLSPYDLFFIHLGLPEDEDIYPLLVPWLFQKVRIFIFYLFHKFRV
jgi:hypothetical protein